MMNMTDDDDVVKSVNEKDGSDIILNIMNDHPDSKEVQRKGKIVLDKLGGQPKGGDDLQAHAQKLILELQGLQGKNDTATRQKMKDILDKKKLNLFGEHVKNCLDNGLNDRTVSSLMVLQNLSLGDPECSKKLYKSPLFQKLVDGVKGKKLTPNTLAVVLNLLGLTTRTCSKKVQVATHSQCHLRMMCPIT